MPTAPALYIADLATEIAAAVAAGETPDSELVDRYRTATAPRIPKGRSPLRNFRCDDDLWQRVTDEAERETTTTADVLRSLIAEHLPPRAEIA